MIRLKDTQTVEKKKKKKKKTKTRDQDRVVTLKNIFFIFKGPCHVLKNIALFFQNNVATDESLHVAKNLPVGPNLKFGSFDNKKKTLFSYFLLLKT